MQLKQFHYIATKVSSSKKVLLLLVIDLTVKWIKREYKWRFNSTASLYGWNSLVTLASVLDADIFIEEQPVCN